MSLLRALLITVLDTYLHLICRPLDTAGVSVKVLQEWEKSFDTLMASPGVFQCTCVHATRCACVRIRYYMSYLAVASLSCAFSVEQKALFYSKSF